MPAEHVAVVRKAFAATMADKGFLDEMAQRKIEVDPMTAEDVTQIVMETVNTPPEAVEKAKIASGTAELAR